MDKGLTAPKWMLTVCLKIPPKPKICSDDLPNWQFSDIIEKRLHLASIVRALYFTQNKESRFSSKVAPPSDVGGLFKRPLTCVRCK